MIIKLTKIEIFKKYNVSKYKICKVQETKCVQVNSYTHTKYIFQREREGVRVREREGERERKREGERAMFCANI